MMKPEEAEKPSCAEVFNPDIYGQQAVKIATNVCFAFFVITVLTFTVLGVTYQPPDPWLESAQSLTKLLRRQNATFEQDETVVITAEDTPLALLPGAINQSFVEEEVVLSRPVRNSSLDCPYSDNQVINCSAPGVLFAIENHNLQLFRALEFFSYRIPVRGSSDHECDAAWTYRSSKDGSPRKFRDFRRYTLSVDSSTCDFQVDNVGDWHSGANAMVTRRQRPLPQDDAGESQTSPVVSTAETGADLINDAVVEVSEESFLEGKYLYYDGGGDFCKSMSHYMWSLLCALGEAKYLNRTFVMDLEVCLSSANNPGHRDEPGKDFRFYYDYGHLTESLPVIDKKQFLKESRKQNFAMREVDVKTTPMELLKDNQSRVLRRVFTESEPNNYWFRVCEGDNAKAVRRPWEAIWKSKRINEIVLAICGKMGWEYDAVHVVRGDKAENKGQWPNLNSDTSPEAIVKILDEKLMYGRNVYIATNEMEQDYFDKLRGKWKIFRLDDFKYLWAVGSEWHKKTSELNGGLPVDFDGYMRVEVDSEVLYKAKTRIETFNDLTKDCKNGIGAC